MLTLDNIMNIARFEQEVEIPGNYLRSNPEAYRRMQREAARKAQEEGKKPVILKFEEDEEEEDSE